jgi:anthrone oxygenase-like protein
MFHILQVLTMMLVVIALSPALAHTLELPGKMRLSKEAYLTVQSIYYPGFTIAGGIGEAGGVLATFVLVLLTPRETTAFWLTMGALLGLLATQLVFWTMTQPVNKIWVRGHQLSTLSATFFSVGPAAGSEAAAGSLDWTALRDRWEFSHVVRAGCAGASFVLLVIAAVLGQ